MQTSDSTDLYTLWKHDEQFQTSSSALINAIPFKSDTSKFLVPTIGQVFYTDGYSSMKQDDYYERTLFDEEMEVPCIGTDQKNFDTAEIITFDITGASTRLPLMCKMIIYQQGATHEREPPILVRDVCIQWNGIDGLSNRNENNLQRTKSHDDLLDSSMKTTNERSSNETNRSFSMASSMTEDDDASSFMTAGGTIRHRVSHLLHRHKYLRQIDMNLLGRSEFYSVPFYQYRGRRYGQRNVQIQIDDSDFNQSLNETYSFEPTTYSVTIICPIRDVNKVTDSSKLFHVNIPINTASKHTTIGYINTRQYITIQRTIDGQVVEV
jgi:hypothetical protein